MNNIEIEEAASELLRETGKGRNQLCKMKNVTGEFIVGRRSYVQPDELRTVYLEAFNSLYLAGKLRMVVENDVLGIYELSDSDRYSVTVQSAMATLVEGVKQHGQIFKIHGSSGEFLQCGPDVYFSPDHERIVFLEAIYELMHHGKLEIASDSKKFAVYAMPKNSRSPIGAVALPASPAA